MPGVKGQKNPSRHKRINGYVTGTQQAVRVSETIAFRPMREYADKIKEDMEAKGMSKQQWCDMLIGGYFGDPIEDAETSSVEAERTPLELEAIAFFLENKRVALRRERKQKTPDKGLIEQWKKEIEELEAMLS